MPRLLNSTHVYHMHATHNTASTLTSRTGFLGISSCLSRAVFVSTAAGGVVEDANADAAGVGGAVATGIGGDFPVTADRSTLKTVSWGDDGGKKILDAAAIV